MIQKPKKEARDEIQKDIIRRLLRSSTGYFLKMNIALAFWGKNIFDLEIYSEFLGV